MHGFISPGRGTRFVLRVTVLVLVVTLVHPPLYGQTEEETTPQVISAQGSLAEALEGPVDPATYVLGPSDQLLVILKGPETALHYLRIFPEGNVMLPNHGAFQASGLTLAVFTERVGEALRQYYRNIEIDVQLSVPRRFLIYVFGEVGSPGPVTVTALSRVSNALAQAGGLRGSQRLIEIREEGKPTRIVDQFMFLRSGDFDQNPTLVEGQTIFVPVKEVVVTVIGEVRRTGQYEIVAGETVADLIRYCGGIGPFGDGERILRERIQDAEPQPPFRFSIEDADTVGLANMDAFIVNNRMSYELELPIRVSGGGGRTGVFLVDEPEPLREFLLRLWRIEPTAFDIESAILERPTGNSTTSDQIPFNVREVLAGGGKADMMVQPGDYVFIPPAVTQVFVAGQVVAPGAVPFQPGLPAEKYVTAVGGPNDRGSYGKLKIISREGVERNAERDSVVYRGDTIVVGTKTSRIFGALWVGLVSLTGLVIALVALSNSNRNN